MAHRRVRHLLLALATVGVVVGPAGAQDSGPVPASDVPALQVLLYDTAARPDQREQAAQRLLSRPDVAARNTIRSALSDSAHPSVQQAAARALADRPTADPTLIDPLLRLMDPQTAEPLLNAAGDALAAFKTDAGVLQQLITLVRAGDERVRAVAARTLGTFVDQRAAGALVAVCDPANSPPRVATAAQSALAYLTGVDPGVTDAAGWQRWWAENKNKDEAAFRSGLAASRSARFDLLRTTNDNFADEVQRTLSDLYKRSPRDQKADTLLGYLRSGDATFRTIGCRIAYDSAAQQGDVSPPEPVKEQLRLLVGDAHAEVRRLAARTLAVINDAPAATALLTQLNQERDSQVKAAIADALAPIHDPRAVGPLLALLDDPSIDTAQSAAEAIGQTLGWPGVLAALRQTDPAMPERAGEALRAALARTSPQNNVGLRDDLVQAIAPLRLPDAGRLYRDMLASRLESPKVRRSLLRAFGQLGDARWVGEVAAWIDDPNDKDTRLAAVQALGDLKPAFGDYQDSFVRLLDPRQEKAPDVRDAAWKVLASLSPRASTAQLGPWEKRLSGDPAKVLVVLRQERDNQRHDGRARDAADKDCQIGDLSSQLGQYADAIAAFKRAFDYADQAQDPTTLRTASIGLTRAYLQNRQYADAIQFASQQIDRRGELQGDLVPEIKRAVDNLIDRERNYNAASQLIQLSLNMRPKLNERYVTDLKDRLATIEQRSREHNLLPDQPQNPIEQAESRTSPRLAV